MQSIIFLARFKDAMPEECKIIQLWHSRAMSSPLYAMFDGEGPRAHINPHINPSMLAE